MNKIASLLAESTPIQKSAEYVIDCAFQNIMSRIEEHQGIEKRAFVDSSTAYNVGMKMLPAMFFTVPFLAGGMHKYLTHELDSQSADHARNMSELAELHSSLKEEEEERKRKKKGPLF